MQQAVPAASGTLTASSPSLSLQSWLFFLSPSPKRSAFRSMPGMTTPSPFCLRALKTPTAFLNDNHIQDVVLRCSALSVMGTWYVTIVVIIKYIWPDKEMTPVFAPTRWADVHSPFQACWLHPCCPVLCLLLTGVVCCSASPWTAVFNAMPTICFGFQVFLHSVPFYITKRCSCLLSASILMIILSYLLPPHLFVDSAMSAACRCSTAWAEKRSNLGDLSSHLAW